jgi:hypothetical protein
MPYKNWRQLDLNYPQENLLHSNSSALMLEKRSVLKTLTKLQTSALAVSIL